MEAVGSQGSCSDEGRLSLKEEKEPFIHSFIQQMFIEHPACAELCPGSWGCCSKHRTRSPFSGTSRSRGRMWAADTPARTQVLRSAEGGVRDGGREGDAFGWVTGEGLSGKWHWHEGWIGVQPCRMQPREEPRRRRGRVWKVLQVDRL